MPHCPAGLYQQELLCRWTPDLLCSTAILGNSFEGYVRLFVVFLLLFLFRISSTFLQGLRPGRRPPLLVKLDGHLEEISMPKNDEIQGTYCSFVIVMNWGLGRTSQWSIMRFGAGAFNDTSLHTFHGLKRRSDAVGDGDETGAGAGFWELTEEERTFVDVEMIGWEYE